jgi:hypothetical protein
MIDSLQTPHGILHNEFSLLAPAFPLAEWVK